MVLGVEGGTTLEIEVKQNDSKYRGCDHEALLTLTREEQSARTKVCSVESPDGNTLAVSQDGGSGYCVLVPVPRSFIQL